MSSIKAKKGKCIDCDSAGPETYLIAKRCQMHYWKHRQQAKTVKMAGSALEVDKRAQKKALDLWFVNAIAQMPACCTECDERLIIFAPWAAKAFVAHVLAKAIFKSVATHPLNKIYLCLICHTNFDNWPEEKVMKMKIYPLALKISMQLLQHLHDDELDSLPDYIKAHIKHLL